MSGRLLYSPCSPGSLPPFEEPSDAVARAEHQAAEAEHARRLAEQASALKTRLLAFASHDLKSPLSSLRATCDLLAAAAEDPEEIRVLSRLMQSEVGRMTRLVHDFLDRAALDAGALRLNPVPVQLDALAQRVVAEFALPARLKRQTITLRPPPRPLPVVHGEASRLDRIIANLLDNAVKYSPVGGDITLTLGHNAQDVWCCVEDTGAGIAPTDLERIFEPYAQGAHHSLGGESSHGLGLTLARELAGLHGGTLRASSPAGSGARFTLALPLTATPGAAPD